LITRGHQTIINTISKYRAAHPTMPENGWTRFLALALQANRITVRRTTGYFTFELTYGRECLLPMQLAIESWSLVEWDNVNLMMTCQNAPAGPPNDDRESCSKESTTTSDPKIRLTSMLSSDFDLKVTQFNRTTLYSFSDL
jgi:hypothetical protein